MVTPGLRDTWAAVAAEHPDRAAIVAATERRSFAEVVRGADGITAWLGAAGVATGDRVALVLPGGAGFFEVIAGALVMGAVPLTIDACASADEVHRAVDATDAKAVVHGPAEAGTVTRALKRIQRRWRPVQLALASAPPSTPIPRPEGAEPPTACPPGTVVLVAPAPGSSAAVTRLETGTIVEAAQQVGPDGDRAHLIVGSVAHGAALVESLITLSAGGTVVLPTAADGTDDLLDTITREGVARVTVDESMRAQARTLRERRPELTVVVATTRADDADVRSARTVIETGRGPVDPVRIEARVAAHRGVAACRVVGLATRSGPPAIVALVVVAEGHYLDAAELRAWARHKLDAPETPRLWLFVDTLEPGSTDAQVRSMALAQLQPGRA